MYMIAETEVDKSDMEKKNNMFSITYFKFFR